MYTFSCSLLQERRSYPGTLFSLCRVLVFPQKKKERVPSSNSRVININAKPAAIIMCALRIIVLLDVTLLERNMGNHNVS